MSTEDALRFLGAEAKRCRDRDSHEAFCLLLPALLRVLNLQPMDSAETVGFLMEFREELTKKNEPARQPALTNNAQTNGDYHIEGKQYNRKLFTFWRRQISR